MDEHLDDDRRAPDAEPSDTSEEFRRELRSLALVYLALVILPLLTGFACQS